MQVHVEWFPARSGTTEKVAFESGADATAGALLARLDVIPDHVLVVRGGVPIPLDASLADGDRVRIVHAVSGG